MHVHMPPELLVTMDVPRSVIKSMYLLPSLMHRLESLMLASQLREEINCDAQISSSLVILYTPKFYYSSLVFLVNLEFLCLM